MYIQLTLEQHGAWVPRPLNQIPKSINAQVPYINWCRIMHTVFPLFWDSPPWMENTLFDLWLVESLDAKSRNTEWGKCRGRTGNICNSDNNKKNPWMWTRSVQTHAVQGSAVVPILSKTNKIASVTQVSHPSVISVTRCSSIIRRYLILKK